jgi:hypothetical protein
MERGSTTDTKGIHQELKEAETIVKRILRAAWYTFILVGGGLSILGLIVRYPLSLVGLVVLLISAIVFEKVYRSID